MICTIYHQDQQFQTLAGVGQLAVLCIHLIDAYSWEQLKILRDKSETVLNATKKRSTFRTLSHPLLHLETIVLFNWIVNMTLHWLIDT